MIKKLKELLKSIKRFIEKIEKNQFNTIELVLIFIMALVFGLLIGEAVFSGNKSITSITYNNTTEINEIESVFNTITKEYINEIDKEKLKEAAINGMLGTLKDQHSLYYNKSESEKFEEELNGYFYGLGVSIYKSGENPAVVNEVYENSPAEKYGINKDDKIIKINNENVEKLSTSEISEKIKGQINKEFVITVEREEKQLDITIKTGKVEIESATSKIIETDNKKIGYIRLSIFASNTDEQLSKKLKELEKQEIKDIIIDLRNNQGGQLDTVINVASMFLEKKIPILQIESKEKTEIKYSLGSENKKYNIVILINNGSASASEVLAAALNEQLNAELIGTTTYGKGTVQKTKNLSNGGIIKYTIETWKTSKGESIDKKGIKPTIEIEQNQKYYQTYEDKDDAQLQKAIETLEK